MKYHLNTRLIRTYYYKSLEGMTAPFVAINYYAKGMQKNPERYQRIQEEKKIKKFLKNCSKIQPSGPHSMMYAAMAAKHYLFSNTSPELKQKLNNEINRLRQPLTNEQHQELKELTNQLFGLFNQLSVTKV
jgi:hypothetical protein